jgi:hypothetical protein
VGKNGNINVVIPIYKNFDQLTKSEVASLRQVVVVLNKFKIIIVCPESVRVRDYSSFSYDLGVNLNYKFFDSKYFKGIGGYNKLLMSTIFYKSFKNTELILIYQLDAWVFADELDYWISKNYDYIGAPLFAGYGENEDYRFIDGQNGGVSLRNVSSALKILRRLKMLKFFHIMVRLVSFNQKKSLKNLLRVFNIKDRLKIADQDYLRELFSDGVNEDYRWSYYIARTFSDFKIAPLEDSISFCFEVHPAYLYKLNNQRLPFAAHAWEKYEPLFWEKFI